MSAPKVTIMGGSLLMARLSAVAHPFPEIASSWQDRTVNEMRATAPSRTGHLRASIRRGPRPTTKATVYGDFWGLFIDRGTKPHEIEARRVKALRFQGPGQTIFGHSFNQKTIFRRKVHHRGTRRRPFITVAAHNGLRGWSNDVAMLWNRRAEGWRWRTGL